MLKLKSSITITKGADLLKKIPEFLESLKKQKTLAYASWSVIGEYMIKHSKDGVSRGRLIQTFKKLGIDLSRFASNTERLPNSPKIDTNEIGKGLREFVLPDGNRIKLSAYIDKPDRMFADILNDKRTNSALSNTLKQLMQKIGLKPEGGRSGNTR